MRPDYIAIAQGTNPDFMISAIHLQSGFQYDDSIVRQMIECIKVYPDGKLEIIFGGGYIVEESITAE